MTHWSLLRRWCSGQDTPRTSIRYLPLFDSISGRAKLTRKSKGVSEPYKYTQSTCCRDPENVLKVSLWGKVFLSPICPLAILMTVSWVLQTYIPNTSLVLRLSLNNVSTKIYNASYFQSQGLFFVDILHQTDASPHSRFHQDICGCLRWCVSLISWEIKERKRSGP
jgi:hypothetical protein